MKKIVLAVLFIAIAYSVIAVVMPRYAYSSGQSCGGFGGETRQFKCRSGFKCYYSDQYPDSQGTCIFSPLFTLNELRMKIK